MTKSEFIKIRVSESQKEYIEMAAKQEGKSVTAYLLDKIFVPTKKLDDKIVSTKETTLKGELKRIQKPKGIYSTERRPSAKDSLNRVNIDF